MKKILIVDSDRNAQMDYRKTLTAHFPHTQVLQAFTSDQGRTMFAEHPDVEAIVFDGCPNSHDRIDCLPLVKEIKATYRGHMLAGSNSFSCRTEMITAGCTHTDEKHNIPKVLSKLFSLQNVA